jgi:hypothetical protein
MLSDKSTAGNIMGDLRGLMDFIANDLSVSFMGNSLAGSGFSGALEDFLPREVDGMVPDGRRLYSDEGGPVGGTVNPFSMMGFGIIQTYPLSTTTVLDRVLTGLSDVVGGGTDISLRVYRHLDSPFLGPQNGFIPYYQAAHPHRYYSQKRSIRTSKILVWNPFYRLEKILSLQIYRPLEGRFRV